MNEWIPRSVHQWVSEFPLVRFAFHNELVFCDGYNLSFLKEMWDQVIDGILDPLLDLIRFLLDRSFLYLGEMLRINLDRIKDIHPHLIKVADVESLFA